MPVIDRTTADKKFRDVCLSCYLPTCFEDHHYLSRYCPIKVCKRFKLDPARVAEISRTTQINQRWQFVAAAKEAASERQQP